MSNPLSRRTLLAASLATAGGAVLASCTSSAPTGNAGTTAPTTRPTTKITISLIPILDVAPAYVAQAKGFFTEFGLEVETVLAQGGAAIVPAVVGGSAQIGFSNNLSLIIANTRGMPLRVVSAAVASTGKDLQDANTVVAKDPAIRSAADLVGKRVSTNTSRGIGDAVVSAAVRAAGGDPSTITWVELPFPNVEQAVEIGQIDAGWLSAPFATTAVDHGMRVISTPLTEMTDHVMQVSSYFSTDAYVAANPQVVSSFQGAMAKALAYAKDNPDEVRTILPEFMQISPELAAKVVLPDWPTSLDRKTFEVFEEVGREAGFVEGTVDLDKLLGGA